ncbi:FG-GAP repeat domain-containing protein [Candidatus Eisenbacteria bacterium]|uniref:FG-GAP repeat domain-containing protein n=1 Tax=Eiseniibacteriota bacterium TaxID=2212470 RepID=A0ABV6YK31_UNCEI
MRTIAALLLLACLSLPTAASAQTPSTSHIPVKKDGGHIRGVPVGGDRVDGDTIEEAWVITGLPFTGTGNTCLFNNDYDEACPYSGSVSPDVVYAYSPPTDTLLMVDMCSSSYDTKVYIYEDALGNLIECDDDGCGSAMGYTSVIWNAEILGSHIYFIVVDGYGGDCGPYLLELYESEPCILECPPGALFEGEPICHADYEDEYNGGCNFDSLIFQDLPSLDAGPITMCGTGGCFAYGTSLYRDIDWYQLVVTGPETINWTVESNVSFSFYILDGTQGCNDIGFASLHTVTPCGPFTFADVRLDPGTYWFWCAVSRWSEDLSCETTEYVWTLERACVTAACCVDGVCSITCDDDCAAMGGEFLAGWISCDPNPCVEYACCTGDSCSVLPSPECAAGGGEWHVSVTSCDPNPCLAFACCVGNACQIADQITCAYAGGEWLDGVTSCDPNPCRQYACCTGDTCLVARQAQCDASGGEWQEGMDTCDPNPCLGLACCTGTSCQVSRPAECDVLGGEWFPSIVSCDPNPCLLYACCLGVTCQIESQITCSSLGGEWFPGATLCDPNPCPEMVLTEYLIDDDFDGVHSVYATDLDGDEDVDVLGAALDGDAITWWENDGGNPIVWMEQTIDDAFDGARSVFAADVDGDGDVDVLGAAVYADEVAWWENDGEIPPGWTKHQIDGMFDRAQHVYAVDMDGDDDLDVLGAGNFADEIVWWENDGAIPPGWTKHTIDDAFDGAASVYAADLDGDLDLDVIGAADTADEIAWWENDGTIPPIWTKHTIHGSYNGTSTVHAADLDGDGDIDVLGAGTSDDLVTWWENIGGTPIGWIEHGIDSDFNGGSSVYAKDINGDGHVDILGAAHSADQITWWENDGATTPGWTEHTLNGAYDGSISVYAADLDGDGDPDVVGGADYLDDVTWWENETQRPHRACCTDGICSMRTVTACITAGGEWDESSITCDPSPCGPYACCLDGSCQIFSDLECDSAGGDWLAGLESCDPNPCFEYVCCTNQSCRIVRQDVCSALNGEWLEGLAICDPNPCLDYACCSGDTCSVMRQDLCATAGGVWQEGIDSCDPNPCLEYACCVGESCSSLQPLECETGGGAMASAGHDM